MLPLLSSLSPNTAILLLTLGLALIAIELNRPGWIIPGTLGLLIALLAAASLLFHHPSASSALECLATVVALVFTAWRGPRTVRSIPIIATVLLVYALRTLIPQVPGPQISEWVAISCGLLLGIGTTVLTRIARRARRNKGLD